MLIKLNYSINDEDLDAFVENLHKYSRHEKKERVKLLIISIFGPILLSVLINKLSPGTPTAFNVLVIILGFFILYKTGISDSVRDNKKLIRERKNRFIGEKEVLLTVDRIKVKSINNKRKLEIENQWREVDFYIREKENIFIYVENKNIVHQLKPGSKTDEVEDFLIGKDVTRKV